MNVAIYRLCYLLLACDAREQQMWMTQLQLCARRHSDGSAKVTQLHLTRHTVLSFPSFTSLSLPLAFDSTVFVSRLSSFDFVHPVIDDVLTVLSVSASCHPSSLCLSLTHILCPD